MANPRQRRKARSSSHRPVSHSRHAKRNLKKTPPIRGPKVLQEAWNNRKTVRQNYAALGLVSSLNPSLSGGVEVPDTIDPQPSSSSSADPIQPSPPSSSNQGTLPPGYGRIIRDVNGNVIDVELNEEPEEEEEPDVSMEVFDPKLPQKDLDKWAPNNGAVAAEGTVVEALERIASNTSGGTGNTVSASLSGVGARHASAGEKTYLRRLVEKHGLENVSKMAIDRKLNYEQRTEGELRRALRRAGFV